MSETKFPGLQGGKKMSTNENDRKYKDLFIDKKWRDLFLLGGVSSASIALLIIIAISAFFIWPYTPGFTSVEATFSKIHNSGFVGLMSLDLFMIVVTIITIPFFLALYVALKHINESYSLLALILGLFACLLILTVRPISEMFELSSKYYSATTITDKNRYLTAGETLNTLFNGTAWILYMILFGISQLISSILMLRSAFFTRKTAIFGIILTVGMTSVIPKIGVFINLLTTTLGIAWFVLIAIDFNKLYKATEKKSHIDYTA